jgi:AAA15 family ATPase/GTPase
MANLLNNIEIKNFKSIKHLKMDSKRVNVFIGKPNVGKSNILEALSLLGAQYSINHTKFLSEFIRYQEISNLFYDDDLNNIIELNSDKISASIKFHTNNANYADLMVGPKKLIDTLSKFAGNLGLIQDEINKIYEKEYSLNPDAIFLDPFYISMTPEGLLINLRGNSTATNPIKKYQFSERSDISNKFPSFLLTPDGSNLFSIIDHNPELRKEIAEIFSEYGLQFVAYKKENKFEIGKNIDGYINKFHFSSIADTFKRLIFYYAVIDSNKDSVLILEEPEVHSFPPYTKELSDRIIESKDNQFFITTHSPYLLQNFLSDLDSSELNVFITYFENYETKIHKLTDDDLRRASEFSVDLFYNLNQFVPNA